MHIVTAFLLAHCWFVPVATVGMDGHQTSPPPREVKFAELLASLPGSERAARLTSAAEAGVVFSEEEVPGAFDLLTSGWHSKPT